MRKPGFLGLLLLCGFVLLAPGGYADGGISVKAELDKAFITIGDPVLYSVTITHDADIQVLSRIPLPPEKIFKIKKAYDIKEEDDDGRIVEGRRFKLTTFQLGEYILDPITIQYRVGGGEVEEIETSRIFLTVESVAGDEEKTDIKDIKTIIGIPLLLVKWLIWILLGGFLVAVVLLIWWRFKTGKIGIREARVLSPEDQAITDLNTLFDSDLIRQGQVKQYYFKLSEVLRVYMEKRFDFLAVESTTYEIMNHMREHEFTQSVRNKVRDVLEFSDLAKFAKWKPEPAEILTVNKKSREIIEDCRPVETETEEKPEEKS